MSLAAGAYRCDCGPDCAGAPTCCPECCAGRRAARERAARDPLGYLTAEAARYARANPDANPDTFIVAMSCRFTPAEERAIRLGFDDVRTVSVAS